jgi:hypothetical protein
MGKFIHFSSKYGDMGHIPVHPHPISHGTLFLSPPGHKIRQTTEVSDSMDKD